MESRRRRLLSDAPRQVETSLKQGRLARRSVQLLSALAITVVVAALPPAASAAMPGCTPDGAWPTARPDLAAQVVDLINAHRAQMGLQPLTVSPTLTDAATWKARHMAAYAYLTHDDQGPAPRSASDRMAACGYPSATWGENIAMGYATPQAVVDAWLASPGHRANIERADYVATGVAVAGTDQSYWAESFGSVDDGAAAAPTEHAAASLNLAARSSSTSAMVRVSCSRHGQRVACHVRNGKGATVRIAIRRAGRTFARARAQVQTDDLRVPLRAVRRLHAGRYDLVVRATAPAGTRESRLSFNVG
jgi:uncharacterized protein YkwD